jgi:hypothetical protein
MLDSLKTLLNTRSIVSERLGKFVLVLRDVLKNESLLHQVVA